MDYTNTEVFESALDVCWDARAGEPIDMSAIERMAMLIMNGNWHPGRTGSMLTSLEQAHGWLQDAMAYATAAGIEFENTGWAGQRVGKLARALGLVDSVHRALQAGSLVS